MTMHQEMGGLRFETAAAGGAPVPDPTFGSGESLFEPVMLRTREPSLETRRDLNVAHGEDRDLDQRSEGPSPDNSGDGGKPCMICRGISVASGVLAVSSAALAGLDFSTGHVAPAVAMGVLALWNAYMAVTRWNNVHD